MTYQVTWRSRSLKLRLAAGSSRFWRSSSISTLLLQPFAIAMSHSSGSTTLSSSNLSNTMSSPVTLDSIPAEILQRIASFSDSESVLALIKVNRYIHRTCFDSQVFKSILRNRNGCGGKPWDCELFDTVSTSDLARLALADLRARTWLDPTEKEEYNEKKADNENRDQRWVIFQSFLLRKSFISEEIQPSISINSLP